MKRLSGAWGLCSYFSGYFRDCFVVDGQARLQKRRLVLTQSCGYALSRARNELTLPFLHVPEALAEDLPAALCLLDGQPTRLQLLCHSQEVHFDRGPRTRTWLGQLLAELAQDEQNLLLLLDDLTQV